MFTKIMYFTIVVSDQDKALDFYTTLGFEKRIDYPGPEGRFLTLGFKDQNVEVLLWKGVQQTDDISSSIPISENPGTLFIETQDLRSDFDILVTKGVKFIEDSPEEYPYGIRITALDPDGNRVALRQRK